jgi:hypothetical protein
MAHHHALIQWAAKVPQWQIRRLYETFAQGILDEAMMMSVGFALWERCDSILTVTAAHYGRVRCPSCGATIERHQPLSEDEVLTCLSCAWSITWALYHQSYRGKQLFGANAIAVFERYHQAFPQAQTANAKMLLIDRLIHAFHVDLKQDIGRPVAANLIQGSLAEVIEFLDRLTNEGTSAADSESPHAAWRRTLAATSWFNALTKKKADE